MAVPFAKLHAAVCADRRERDVRDIASKLTKALVGRGASRVMRDYDSRMQDTHISDAGTALMSCIPDNPLIADLYIDTGKPVSIISILNGNFNKGDGQRILALLAKSFSQGMEAVVVFRVRHMGVWVAYNTADPFPLSIPRLVVPSSRAGQSAITMMPMSGYMKMWNLKRGDSE